jgi:hypothetical protein
VGDANEWAWRDFRVTFAGNVVNQPIDPCEFTLESLGVKLGDRVSDTTLKLSYLYKGEAPEKSNIPADIPFTDTKAVEPSRDHNVPGPPPGLAPGASRDSRVKPGTLALGGTDQATPTRRRTLGTVLVSVVLLALATAGILFIRRGAGREK